MKKSNWTYVGFSHHSVPSLSRHATRFSTGTCVASSRKARTASRVGPGRHEGSTASCSVIGCSPSFDASPGAAYAPETEMAHAGVHHLWPAGGGSVAQAVGVGAQVRPALDHLASDAELRLCRVIARTRSRHREDSSGAQQAERRRIGVAAGPPVLGPLPHVAGHVEAARYPFAGKLPTGEVRVQPLSFVLRQGKSGPSQVLAMIRPVRAGFVAPGELGALEAASGGVLPLGLSGQIRTGPVDVGARVLVGDVDHRVIRAAFHRAARSFGLVPAGARGPGPPLTEVAQVHRAARRGEHHRSRDAGSPAVRRGRRPRRSDVRRRSRGRLLARTSRTARWSPGTGRSRTRRRGRGGSAPPPGSAARSPSGRCRRAGGPVRPCGHRFPNATAPSSFSTWGAG